MRVQAALRVTGMVLGLLFTVEVSAGNNTRVCVSIVEHLDAPPAKDKSEGAEKQISPAADDKEEETPAPSQSQKMYTKKQVAQLAKAYARASEGKGQTYGEGDANLPVGQTAFIYLKRLMEHYVTHQPGYVSVPDKCDETLTVELYPLERGWTVFARYTGTNREEKVDELFGSELSQFSERAVIALLKDVPISTTINRENVLRADSNKSVQRIKGSNHFILSVGTLLKGAWVDQVIMGGNNAGQVERRIALYTPLKLSLGYRGRFQSWGLEATGHLGIGVGKVAAASNPAGGHVDYGGDAGVAIHFLRYFDPRGLASFYLGAGGTFEVIWFSIINPQGYGDARDYTAGGGLSGDFVFGWEFMRASAVQFFIQGELNLPAYVTEAETGAGRINSWMPGVTLKLGMVF